MSRLAPLTAGFAAFLRRGRAAHTAPRELESGVFHLANLFVHLYGVRTARGAVLFDAGLDRRARPLDALLDGMGRDRDALRAVLLTHGHPDHVAGAVGLDPALVAGGRPDLARFRGVDQGGGRAERVFRRLVPTPAVEPGRLLDGGEVLNLDGVLVEVVAIPGDTPGALAYHARGCLFVGDGLELRGDGLRPAPAFATDDAEANLRAIVALAERFCGPGLLRVCPAHGGPTPPGRASELLARAADEARARLAMP